MSNFCRCFLVFCFVMASSGLSGCSQTDWETECFREIETEPAVQCPAVDIWSVFKINQDTATPQFYFNENDGPDMIGFDFTQNDEPNMIGFDFTQDDEPDMIWFDFTQDDEPDMIGFDFTQDDEEKPEKRSKPVAKIDTVQAISGTGCVDINIADETELMRLPGIGANRARLIIQTRQRRSFKRIKDLTRVKGIGAQSVKKMAGWICEINPAT